MVGNLFIRPQRVWKACDKINVERHRISFKGIATGDFSPKQNRHWLAAFIAEFHVIIIVLTLMASARGQLRKRSSYLTVADLLLGALTVPNIVFYENEG